MSPCKVLVEKFKSDCAYWGFDLPIKHDDVCLLVYGGAVLLGPGSLFAAILGGAMALGAANRKRVVENQKSLLFNAITAGTLPQDVANNLFNAITAGTLPQDVANNLMHLHSQKLLALAAGEGHVQVINYLLSKGLNLRAVNTAGKTAWQKAEKNNRKEVLKLITKYQIDKLKEEEYDATCPICMDADPNDDNARFTLCDYQCLTPICTQCKATLPNKKCPHCRADLCQNIPN